MNESRARAAAAGQQLIEVHIRLSEELARMRESGVATGRLATSDLRSHCAAFCGALTEHHTSEDDDVFAVLAAAEPGLVPVLDELRRDHVVIAESLRVLDEALSADADPIQTRTQLDTIAALMETHFSYEERKLVDALNASSVMQIRPVPEASA